MNQAMQLILCLIIFAGFFLLSRYIMGWKIKQASKRIILDLRNQGAVDHESAVELPYSKRAVIRFGLRDYRPKALEYMVQVNLVGLTETGKFFLREEMIKGPI